MLYLLFMSFAVIFIIRIVVKISYVHVPRGNLCRMTSFNVRQLAKLINMFNCK